MFCPVCKSEYRHGYTRCADCDVDLVYELANEPANTSREPQYAEFQPLLSTYNSADISFIKSLLDNEDINYYFQGENFHIIRSGMQPAVLMVQKEHFAGAKAILKDVDLRYLLFSHDENEENSE
jgi:hypothetical protein